MERRIFMVKKRKRWYVRIRQVMLLFALVFLCSAPLMISVKAEENSSQTATKTDATTEYESKTGGKVILKDGKYVYKNTGEYVHDDLVKIGKKWYNICGGEVDSGSYSVGELYYVVVNHIEYSFKDDIAYTGNEKRYDLTITYTDGIITSVNGAQVSKTVYKSKSGNNIVLKNNRFYYKSSGKRVDTDFIKIGKKWYLIRYGYSLVNWIGLRNYNGWYVVGGHIGKSDGTPVYAMNGIAYTGNMSFEGGTVYTGSKAFTTSTEVYYLIDGEAVKSYDSKSGKAVIKSNGEYVYGRTRKTVTKDLVRIGSKLHYIKNGTLQKKATGTVKINGKSYYIRKGVAYTGNRTINGAKYYYYDGVKGVYKSKSGRTVVKKNNKYIYINKKKTTVSGKIFKVVNTAYVNTQEIINSDLVRVNGKLYYIRDGKQQTNTTKTVKINGKSYYIKKGVAYTGYRTVKGVKYYYKDGIKSKETTEEWYVNGGHPSECKANKHTWETNGMYTQETHDFCNVCGIDIDEAGGYDKHLKDTGGYFGGGHGGNHGEFVQTSVTYQCLKCGATKIVKVHKRDNGTVAY